jgi:hypothetical protein
MALFLLKDFRFSSATAGTEQNGHTLVKSCSVKLHEIMKNALFRDVTPCGSCNFLRNVGSYKSHMA